MKRKIIKLFLIIICMGSIFFLSSDTAEVSSHKSSTVIVKVTETVLRRNLNSKEKKYYVRKFVKYVRKGAHFSLYFLLGFFVISFLMEYMVLSWKSIFYTILFVFLYACSDEIHQLFISGRSGEILDVFIDTSGGMFSVVIYSCFKKIRRRLYEQKKAIS